ncbi:GspE/PulE family protein [Pseudomonas azotoformans]|uniref:General secretion pathway protein GspE n=1 Tax=Pseudomonas azotoformans TaxID=47878 RepID=A0A127I1I4_PSEAZ|nr:GspE/PulE family protein [Pseudomonas azotoformans]AMN80587.1 general secretion pathway protein GspE [Pseudomonas azotoformans]
MTTDAAVWIEVFIASARSSFELEREPVLLALQRLSGRPTAEVLAAVHAYTGWLLLEQHDVEQMSADFNELEYAECLKRECLFMAGADKQRWLVTSDPLDPDLASWASYKFDGLFQLAFAHPQVIKTQLAVYEGQDHAITRLSPLSLRIEDAPRVEEISPGSIARDQSQVIRLVNSTLYDAHRQGASDIHFENTGQGLVVKYRTDGVLSPARTLADRSVTEEVISRIKVMAELDIGEKRIPQDGRFAVAMNARTIDFRVSVMPSMFGEDVVLRILDKQSLTAELARLDLQILGFDSMSCDAIRKLASQPYGMLLVTGPTGSGKTTTLYATLSEINQGKDKIITIEDPVEYQLPGALQIPVNERKGLTFARGLRSILRHDPDRILVGEIRDKETAEIAVQAALTGHLVYTTVHANSVFDVLSRFRHMGVDIYSFVTALNGVVAQRLVRLLCMHCAEPSEPDATLLGASGLNSATTDDWAFRQGRGCAHCRGLGYKGRKALAEVLVLTDGMRELILGQAPITELKTLARQQGMRSLRDQALQAVKEGLTSLEEINRVTFVD